jgi:dephospho-CoA kinase
MMHVAIMLRLEVFIKNNDYPETPFILVESATMIKTNFYKIMDKVVFVDAPIEVRKERSKLRSFTDDDFHNRNKIQDYIVPEDFIIFNNDENSNIDELFEKIMN